MRLWHIGILVCGFCLLSGGKGDNTAPTSRLATKLSELRSGEFNPFLGSEISQECVRAVENLTSSQRSMMLDSWGKPGGGIKQGNRFWFGSYEECGTLNQAEYCLASVMVPGAPFPIGLIGTCVPSQCSRDDLEFVFDKLLGLVGMPFNATISCPPMHQSFSTGSIVVIACLVFLASLVLIASFIDFIGQHLELHNTISKGSGLPSVDTVNDAEKLPLLKTSMSARYRRGKTGRKAWTFGKDVLLGFSLYKTLPAILSTKQPASAINCINGIRVLSMFWVIGAHTNLWFFMSALVDDMGDVVTNVAPQFSYQGILNGFFSVDSFFFLSGLLVSYLTLREMSRRASKKGTKRANVFPFLTYYLHRFLRLTPAYVAVIVIVSQLMPSLSDGPMFSAAAKGLTQSCDKYWWTNLLYINNFYPPNMTDNCVAWTWYLANDMQFYIISPLMVIPLYFFAPVGLLVTGIILACSLGVTATLSGVYNIGASPLSLLFQPNASTQDYSDIYYTKPYCRIPPYLVGIVVGYLVYKNFKLPFNKRIVNSAVYKGLMLFALGIIVAVVYGLYGLSHDYHYSRIEMVSYDTLSRLAWGIALGLIVLACHHNYGWWVNRFLSWPFWIPLSRLTYLAYLIHPVVLYTVIDGRHVPSHFSNKTMAVYMISCTVLAYGMAAVLAVLVEFPFSNMETAAFKLIGVSGRDHKNAAVETAAAKEGGRRAISG